MLGKKANEYIKFRWLEDEEEGEDYFELRIRIDAITKEGFIVTDFAEEDEIEETQMLWDNQVADLKWLLERNFISTDINCGIFSPLLRNTSKKILTLLAREML